MEQPAPLPVAHAAPSSRWIILLGLLATAAVYARTLWQSFVSYDDRLFIHINPQVLAGWTSESLLWALRIDTPSMWHPLTWWSYQFNAQISLWFGQIMTEPLAWPFKLTNVLLHLLSGGLLYGAMRCLTRRANLAAIIACLFLLHPANVESVAWVAERKNALSQVFVMACLWAYAMYAQRRELKWMGITLLLFAVGLMAKPAILTLPAVFLLLDFWPLRRWRTQGGLDTVPRLLGEKIPLLVLAAADAVVTFINGRIIQVVVPLGEMSVWDRVLLLPVTYVRYLFHMILPVTVGPMQPPVDWTGWHVVGAVVLLCAITIWAIRQWSRQPWLLVGWLWFLGTLFPMVGFIKTSQESMADRHLYYPGLGLLLAGVFGVASMPWVTRSRWLPAGVGLLLAVMAVLSYQQVTIWDNSRTLYTHAINQSPNNVWAHNNLGAVYWLDGELDQAVSEFEKAVAIDPQYEPAVNNLQAVREMLAKPDPLQARLSYARYTRQAGQVTSALAQLRYANRLWPGHPVIALEMGKTLIVLNQRDDARAWLAIADQSGFTSAVFAKEMQLAYEMLGDEGQALRWRERAEHSPSQPQPQGK